jgi:hypothetical protein
LSEDLDKNRVAIRYNVLNLPDTIQFRNGNQIVNCYQAGGKKLRTKYYTAMGTVVVPVGTIHTNTANSASLRLDDYVGSILYEKGTSESNVSERGFRLERQSTPTNQAQSTQQTYSQQKKIKRKNKSLWILYGFVICFALLLF